MQKLCTRNIQALQVTRLEEDFRGYPIIGKLHPILKKFFAIFETFCSDVTNKVWMRVCHHNMASLDDLVDRVWPAFTVKLHEVVLNLDQLKVPCREAEKLLPTGTAPQQLQAVIKGLNACGMSVANINVDEISSKVQLYGGLQAVTKEAKQLLRVIHNFQLQGELVRVLHIADVSSCSLHASVNFLTRSHMAIIASPYLCIIVIRFQHGLQKSLSVSWIDSMKRLQSSCPDTVHSLPALRSCPSVMN